MKKIATGAVALLLAGCASSGDYQLSRPGYKVNTEHPSANQNERTRFLVLHYTATDDAESMRLLTQSSSAVSAHYLVPSSADAKLKQGIVYQLVPEDKRAWHAGVSDWNGRSNLNDTSIGVEIVNLGYRETPHGKDWYPWDPQQIGLVARLASDIIQRYGITPDNVVGHSDIAPGRKFDPGPLFPWQKLAEQGIGAWPDKQTVSHYLAGRSRYASGSISKIQANLALYGYKIAQSGQNDAASQQVISAFQMHFRPTNYTGVADAETEALSSALVEKYHPSGRMVSREEISDR